MIAANAVSAALRAVVNERDFFLGIATDAFAANAGRPSGVVGSAKRKPRSLDRRRERGWLHLRIRRGRYFGTATVK
jgi:hypothetical protein